MWTCRQCKTDNGDSSTYCIQCGARRVPGSKTAADTYPTASLSKSSPSAKRSAVSPYERTCDQAKALDRWANIVFVLSLLAAAVIFVLPFFTEDVALSNILVNIPTALLLFAGGQITSTVMQGLAMVTEAAYRRMQEPRG